MVHFFQPLRPVYLVRSWSQYRHVLFTSKFLSGLVVSGGLGSMIGIVAVMQASCPICIVARTSFFSCAKIYS